MLSVIGAMVSGEWRRLASREHSCLEARCVRHAVNAAKSGLKVPLTRDPITSDEVKRSGKGEEAAARTVRRRRGGSENDGARRWWCNLQCRLGCAERGRGIDREVLVSVLVSLRVPRRVGERGARHARLCSCRRQHTHTHIVHLDAS